jgi:hydroxyacylglutathione hydrolase
MFLRQIYDESLAQAAYMVGCQRTGEALVIDPERDVDRYIELAAREKLRITAVAETHIHADFLSGARELAERTGARLYLSANGGDDWSYTWLDKKAGGGRYDAVLLKHGDSFKVGNIELRALHTPGHTPEHISFLLTDRATSNEPMGLFTGDFVFVGDMGRPDLLETAVGVKGAKEISARELFDSIKEFTALPEYLQVWPAHGAGSACGKALGAIPQSTVGYELRTSPALMAAREGQQRFVEYILAEQPEPPTYFARMKRLNRDGVPVLGALPAPKLMSAREIFDFANDASNLVLDTRTWDEFRVGHLPGALSTPLDRTFPTVAGSYVDESERIALLIDPSRVEEAVRLLVRVGLDSIVGFAPSSAVAELKAAGTRLPTTDEIDAKQLRAMLNSNDPPTLLDVRRAVEHHAGSITDSPYANVAHTSLSTRLSEVPTGEPLVVHCAGGVRSARAASYLERKGFKPINLKGGFAAWLNTIRE